MRGVVYRRGMQGKGTRTGRGEEGEKREKNKERQREREIKRKREIGEGYERGVVGGECKGRRGDEDSRSIKCSVVQPSRGVAAHLPRVNLAFTH